MSTHGYLADKPGRSCVVLPICASKYGCLVNQNGGENLEIENNWLGKQVSNLQPSGASLDWRAFQRLGLLVFLRPGLGRNPSNGSISPAEISRAGESCR